MNKFFEKAFWVLIAFIASVGVKFLSDINTNLSDLNSKISLLSNKMEKQDQISADHESRIRILERI
jgi:cell division protein FtsL